MTENQRAISILQEQVKALAQTLDYYIEDAHEAIHPDRTFPYYFYRRIDTTMRVYQEKMLRLAELIDREARS